MSLLRTFRPRLLYLPYENEAGGQVGPRDAFTRLHERGALSAYEAYSFRVRASQIGAAAVLDEILAHARAFQPAIVLWQQIGNFPVSDAWFSRLREAAPRTVLVYHDGDPWGRWKTRFTAPMRAACRAADVVCTSGIGFESLFRRAGARSVLYAHSFVDATRFGTPWEPTASREFDAVMICNRNASRIPLLSQPGVLRRQALVRELHRRFGKRFALFGRRWDGCPGWQGPVPYDQQEATARRSWTSVSWDHFHRASYYFSDRVPIALLTGVPHVTNYQSGYENVFRDQQGLLWGRTVSDVADCVELILSEPPQRRNERGADGARFARQNMTALVCFERVLEVVCERCSDRLFRNVVEGCESARDVLAPAA